MGGLAACRRVSRIPGSKAPVSFVQPRILLIDNYDSFTYNLVQALGILQGDIRVFRNDQVTVAAAEQMAPTHIVISPGPGRPEQAGVTLSLIEAFAGTCPILGVCLGHQAIAQAFGGRVIAARTLMHGKSSPVTHDGQGIFTGLPQGFEAGRYHSLAVAREPLPRQFVITAETEDGEIMGIRHTALGIEGVQFHPESILTPLGNRLLGNFLTRTQPEARVAV